MTPTPAAGRRVVAVLRSLDPIEHRTVAATDRGRSTSKSGWVSVGIDTVRVRGPVAPEGLSSLPRQRQRHDLDTVTGVVTITPTRSESSTAAGWPWSIDTWRKTPELLFEASVPRLLRSDNRLAATVAELHSVLRHLHAEVSQHVKVLCEPEELTLMRLDGVRSFENQSGMPLSKVLASLAEVPGRRARTCIHVNRAHTGVQTLERHTERWSTRLYQRAEHYQQRAVHQRGAEAERLQALAVSERDRLRYEVELRSRALTEHGLATVGDLSQAVLEDLAYRYFERSAFHNRVGSDGARLLEAAAALEADGRYKQLPSVLGLLAMEGAGLSPAWASATTAKHSALAKELRLRPSDLSSVGLPATRLDWHTGLVVGGTATPTLVRAGVERHEAS